MTKEIKKAQPHNPFLLVSIYQAANSNGLFSPVGRVLGVSTNGAAPPISSITAAPVDGRTNATELSLSMDSLNVPCRVWYTVQPLQDTVFLNVTELTAEEVRDVARPDSFIDLPQVSEYLCFVLQLRVGSRSTAHPLSKVCRTTPFPAAKIVPR